MGKARTKAPNGSPVEVETWPINKLRPYARNARTHSPEQIAQLRESFRNFGQVWPVLVREDATIIAGHGRHEAARMEGFDTIRVIVARGWTKKQCRVFGLLDNKSALNADWDNELLTIELGDLRNAGVDLDVIGFSKGELERLLPDEIENGSTDPQLGGLSYAVIVRCTGEKHQTEVLAKLEREGLKCEALIS
jgi:hypothetical protein